MKRSTEWILRYFFAILILCLLLNHRNACLASPPPIHSSITTTIGGESINYTEDAGGGAASGGGGGKEMQLLLRKKTERVECLNEDEPDVDDYCLQIITTPDNGKVKDNLICYLNDTEVFQCNNASQCHETGALGYNFTVPRTVLPNCTGIHFAELNPGLVGRYKCCVDIHCVHFDLYLCSDTDKKTDNDKSHHKNTSTTANVPKTASEPSSPEESGNHSTKNINLDILGIGVGVAVIVLVLFAVVCICCYCQRRRRDRGTRHQQNDTTEGGAREEDQQATVPLQGNGKPRPGPRQIDIESFGLSLSVPAQDESKLYCKPLLGVPQERLENIK